MPGKSDRTFNYGVAITKPAVKRVMIEVDEDGGWKLWRRESEWTPYDLADLMHGVSMHTYFQLDEEDTNLADAAWFGDDDEDD